MRGLSQSYAQRGPDTEIPSPLTLPQLGWTRATIKTALPVERPMTRTAHSFPHGLLRQLDRVRRAESCTRDELLQEALRSYVRFHRRFQLLDPTRAELLAIRRGRAAFRRGQYVSLAELPHALDSAADQARRKDLARLPRSEQDRIRRALAAMQEDPFSGDIVRLKAQPTAWRHRVGSYRILKGFLPLGDETR